ncbi:hypothetical protein FHS85_001730 [Rhodoligotrophos appendicifer]|uniref:right-handed parallel beta-helix repeat-containing protein n=1 Tax=Rhodoligotrophos appendicifer TaxID=987056 RepID=UPI0011867329|nr:right-handed parallel beta-helix repeat-containing protein [Rhodoligotrophos appendicifer]
MPIYNWISRRLALASLLSVPLIRDAATQQSEQSEQSSPALKKNPISREWSVNDFNAKGDWDGISGTDNTDAIKRAIRRIAEEKGGSLFFPPGRYLYTNIDADIDDIEVYGAGAVLVSNLPKNTDVAGWWLRGDRIYLHNLTFTYAEKINLLNASDLESRGKNGYGVRIGGRRDPSMNLAAPYVASDIRIENVSVYDARNGGISIYKAKRASVKNCIVVRTLGNGIGFDSCTESVIASGNICEDTGDDLLIVATDGSVREGTASAVFVDNILKGGYAKGLACSGVDRLVATGNVVENTWASGIGIIEDQFYRLGRSHNVICSKNIVFNAGKRFGVGQYKKEPSDVGFSIYVSAGTENIKITDNLLLDGQSNGVCVSKSSGVDISGNTIVNHPGSAIVAGDVDSRDGLRLEGFRICENTVEKCISGISVGGGRNGRVCNNIMRDFELSNSVGHGIYYGNISNSVISGNLTVGHKDNIVSVKENRKHDSIGLLVFDNHFVLGNSSSE